MRMQKHGYFILAECPSKILIIDHNGNSKFGTNSQD